MVFSDSTVKIHVRVRSVIGRLRPSKSMVGLASLFKTEAAPPVPLPMLSLVNKFAPEAPESPVSEEDFWDTKSTAPVMLKRSDKRLTKRTTGFKSSRKNSTHPQPILTSMLEQQGLLDSPISFHITSLIAESCDSIASSSFSRTTRRRSSSDSSYLSRLIGVPSPAREFVVLNTVGKSTPELCTSHHIAQPQSCSPQIVSSHQDDLQENNHFKKIYVVHSPDPSLPPRTMSASPAQCYLRRRGPLPSNQPITSQLLQSVISTSYGPSIDEPGETSLSTITPRSLGLVYNNA